MQQFEFRGIEIHSPLAWDRRHVTKVIEFAEENHLNGIILHQNDIVDRAIYPGGYVGARESLQSNYARYADAFRKLQEFSPLRRDRPCRISAYLTAIAERAAGSGIKVYLENKELSYPDMLLDVHPELWKSGGVCATDPFWWDYLRAKYRELSSEIPGVAGVIVAPGTSESRLAYNSNHCTCELCGRTSAAEWYSNLLGAMYDGLKSGGMDLVVRDFTFTSGSQGELFDALTMLPDDVIIALKNTPHDYYPTFPDNARIGQCGEKAQWLEFDCMGQYYGWGIAPCILADDLRDRMEYGQRLGASGVMLRTDWEGLEGHTCFDTINVLNAMAGAELANGADKAQDYLRIWLSRNGYLDSGSSAGDQRRACAWLTEVLESTWPVVRNVLFVNDCVMNDSSGIPVSYDHAMWLAREKNSLADWDPSRAEALAPTRENILALVARVDEAMSRVGQVRSRIAEQWPAALTEDARQDFLGIWAGFDTYIGQFGAATKGILLTALDQESRRGGAGDPDVAALVSSAIAAMDEAVAGLRGAKRGAGVAFPERAIVSWERLAQLTSDLKSLRDGTNGKSREA